MATTAAGSSRRPVGEPARPRRSEMRDLGKEELVNLVENIIGSHNSSKGSAAGDEQLMHQIRRRLTRLSVESSTHTRTAKMEAIIGKIKAQPDQYRSLPALLELLDRLASGARPSSTTSSPNLGGNSARSPLLEISDLKQQRMKSPLASSATNDSPKAANSNKASTMASPVSESIASPKGKGKDEVVRLSEVEMKGPKNAVLQRWRAKMGVQLAKEDDLLRDVIFLLQGINGKYVGFEEILALPSNDLGDMHDAEEIVRVVFAPETEHLLTQPCKHLIHRIVELGRLYKRISEFSQRTSQQETSGLIMQSLCHFIAVELTEYYRLVVELEAQLNENGAHSGEAANAGQTQELDSKGAASLLTLKQIAVRIEDVTLRMRLISTIIESCQDSHGGAIVSLIHSYTFNGDPFIRKFTAEILEQVSKPFFHSLSLWIFEGELQDPFDEFFVELNKDVKTSALNHHDDSLVLPAMQDGQAASSLWQNQFRIRSEMVPSFLGEGFAKKIFSTGKSLNFIRFSCGDEDWVATRDAMLSHSGRGQNGMLRYADLVGLQRTIDDAYAIASSRLLDILMDKFKLLNHLRALKDYLMLMKGDFIDLLMDSIGPSLSKPASSLYRHNLTASLETAIRGSNSQYDDMDILRRLDARVLDFNEGDLGWDSFTLEYRVDEPVNTVLDGNALLGYQVIFNHLWKIKRVELALGAAWERLISAGNMLRRSRKTFLDEENLSRVSHESLGNLNEQIHFVKQMQGFINLEVIEYSWNDLCQFFATNREKKTEIDLDELIQSHKAYLNALLSKVLLRSSSKKGNSDQLAVEVRTNMDHMLGFAVASDDLAQYITDQLALSSMSRLAKSSSSSKSSRPPSSGGAQRIPATSLTLSNITRRSTSQYMKFQQSTQLIISRLEKHSNLVVRDLSTRLNFNSYYHTVARKGAASVISGV
jgi:gamma-tubulin complex component 3